MTDIVERLRSRIHDAPMPTEHLLDESADEIERLRGTLRYIAAQAKRERAAGDYGVLWVIQSNAEGTLDGSLAKMQQAASLTGRKGNE